MQEKLENIYENAEREYEMLKDRVHDYYDEIQKLKEEIEELREDNYAYHQLMKMQNGREYRSKFLKEFQEEFGKNVLPDYDEIYKRYDKLKKENKKLKELCDKYEEEHNNEFQCWKRDRKELLDKRNRINKAIQFIDNKEYYVTLHYDNEEEDRKQELLDILKGDNK